MEFGLNTVMAFILGAAACWFADRMAARWSRQGDDEGMSRAVAVLKRHRLKHALYLPSVGVAEPELREALDRFAARGYLLLDVDGNVLGRLAYAPDKGPHLRLVVSNN